MHLDSRDRPREEICGPANHFQQFWNGYGRKRVKGPSGVVVKKLKIMKAEKEFEIVEWLTDLCNDIVAEGKIPTDWKRSVLVSVYKGKG